MKKNKLPYDQKGGFKVPENYFDTLETRVMESVTLYEEKELLCEQEGKGFKVPENYFDNFEDRLFEKLENKPKQSKVISLLSQESFYYFTGTAAVFVAIVSTLFSNPSEPIGYEDLDMLTLEGYLHETMIFSNSDVSEYFSDGEFNLAPSSQSDNDHKAVIDYLSETMEEPSIIFNED